MNNNYGVEMIDVSSSNVSSIGYKLATQTLYIKFENGSLYAYRDVPSMQFDCLKVASSKGIYLNRNIKKLYKYERLE